MAPTTTECIFSGAKGASKMRIKKQIERWFEVENDPDGGQILIKHLNPGEISDIMDASFEQSVVYKTIGGKMEPEFKQSNNTKRDRELTLTKAVIGWKNVFGHDDKPLACTPENIILASREIVGFNEMVSGFRARLAKDILEEEKAEKEALKANL
jgi:hypothetical protein